MLFQDLSTPAHKQKLGYAKIEGCCRRAVEQGVDYVWVDTCCIDKRSSAELSEAINSMYNWYKQAVVCYAYLVDVPPGDILPSLDGSAFRRSRWFTRGWTLQELIAPRYLEFFDSEWGCIDHVQKNRGLRSALISLPISPHNPFDVELLKDITGISLAVLINDVDLSRIPVAEIFSWASRRVTTRPEDMAYCLLGLLDINMPLLYGEGAKAFSRLQTEYIRQKDDLSILAWCGLSTLVRRNDWREEESVITTPLADSPIRFQNYRITLLQPLHTRRKRHYFPHRQKDNPEHSENFHETYPDDHLFFNQSRSPWMISNHGIDMELPLIHLDRQNNIYFAILKRSHSFGLFYGVLLVHDERDRVFYRFNGCPPLSLDISHSLSCLLLHRRQIKNEVIRLGNINETPNDFKRRRQDKTLKLRGEPRGMITTAGGFTLQSFYPPVSSLSYGENQVTYILREQSAVVLCFSREDGKCFAIHVTNLNQQVWVRRKWGWARMREEAPQVWIAATDTNKSAFDIYAGLYVTNRPKIKNLPRLQWGETVSFAVQRNGEKVTERFELGGYHTWHNMELRVERAENRIQI